MNKGPTSQIRGKADSLFLSFDVKARWDNDINFTRINSVRGRYVYQWGRFGKPFQRVAADEEGPRGGDTSCTATSNHMAFTPPNRSIAKGVSRFNTDEPYLLQIAPLVAKLHQRMVWSSACLEILFYLFTLVSLPSTGSPVCLASQPNIHITPWFCIGCAAVVLGTYIRLDCFRTLKELFTFDLTIHPEHKLITDRGFYRYVRHPAYTGSLLITAGLCLSHMTKSNWATECGPLLIPGSGFIIGATWFSWTLAVGFSRVNAEDKQMRKLFPQEWDAWAANVPWWFLPGLI